jgi:hypothetical protein
LVLTGACPAEVVQPVFAEHLRAVLNRNDSFSNGRHRPLCLRRRRRIVQNGCTTNLEQLNFSHYLIDNLFE